MVNADNTTNYNNFNTFTGQTVTPEEFAAFSKMAVDMANQQKKLAEMQKKAINDKIAELKGESEAEKEARKLREANKAAELEALKKQEEDLKEEDAETKRQRKLREMRDEQLREYEDEELKRWEEKKKRQQEIAEKEKAVEKAEDESLANKALKNSPVFDVLPDKIQNIKPQNQEEDNDKKEKKGFFAELKQYSKEMMNNVRPQNKQEDGEQKNLGEKIQRVSFHPEGIKILRTLLDPIYKQLNAFTGDMDKGLKGIIEKMEGMFTQKSGIGKILLLALADLLFMSGKIQQFFKFLGETSTRLYAAFEEMFVRLLEGFKNYGKAFKRFLFDEPLNLLERMGLNVRNIASNAFESIVEKLTRLKDSIVKNLKLEEIGAFISRFFNEKILGPINNIKNSIGEFFENRITKPIADFIEKGKNIGKSIQAFFEPLIRPFKEFANLFKGGQTEGFFSRMVSSFARVTEYAKSFVGPIQQVFKFLEPVLNLLKPFITLIEGLAKLVSVEVISVIMGIVDAVKTFFDVWKDDKLGPIQKTVSVIAGFIGGIGSLASDTLKAISSILSIIPGMGWASKGLDKVAEAINTHNLGKDTAQAFRDYNDLNAPDNTNAYKEGAKYKNASPEEKKKMDEQFAAARTASEHKGMHFVSQGKDPKKGIWVKDEPVKDQKPDAKNAKDAPKPAVVVANPPAIVAEPAPTPIAYQPTPIDYQQKLTNISYQKTQEELMKSMIVTNKQILESLNKKPDYKKEEKPTMIVNQNQQVAKHDDTKDYLTKKIRDSNYDRKIDWYSNSVFYRATVP